MREPGQGFGRLARGTAFAAAAEPLALAAHLAGGGRSPSVADLLVIGVLLVLASVGAAGGRRGPLSIVVGLGLAQWLLHHAFSVLSMPATVSTLPAHGLAGSHPGGHLVPLAAAPGALSTPGMADMHVSGGMLLFHVLATVLTALVLARGEAVLWRLVGCLCPRLPLASTPLEVAVSLPVTATSSASGPLRLEAGGPGRRGPPKARLAF